MFELIQSNKRRSVALVAVFVLVVALVGAADRHARRQRRPVHTSSRWSSAALIAFTSYWKADKIALSVSRARPADPERVPAAAQPRRGSVHRRRPAEAGRLRDRRPGPERVRHRTQPEARGDRRHHRAAREDESRRTRRRRSRMNCVTSATTTSSCRRSPSRWSARSR